MKDSKIKAINPTAIPSEADICNASVFGSAASNAMSIVGDIVGANEVVGDIVGDWLGANVTVGFWVGENVG